MTMPNKSQKELIKSIERSAEKASYAFCQVQQAYKITGVATPEREKYLEALQSYMIACNKILLEIQLAFGEGADDINLKRAANERLKPHTLN